jgi:hypothetical protein
VIPSALMMKTTFLVSLNKIIFQIFPVLLIEVDSIEEENNLGITLTD